ncbi:MAG: hypothetical protein QOJ39_487 [Candidatus Eremiobacteraeota bacterium]|jgi:hypothetical protein|nr:hypothetical protein [Candidatus Eremiobacteraeota bacterium]MEA2718623.1 hypothetical protein [Candidatus Eremiobacteraeota bacterium]
MSKQDALVTFEKTIGPGVSVHVTNIPAEIVRCEGKEDLTLFDFDTSSRLQHLLRAARARMANGESDIILDFSSHE